MMIFSLTETCLHRSQRAVHTRVQEGHCPVKESPYRQLRVWTESKLRGPVGPQEARNPRSEAHRQWIPGPPAARNPRSEQLVPEAHRQWIPGPPEARNPRSEQLGPEAHRQWIPGPPAARNPRSEQLGPEAHRQWSPGPR